VTTLELRKRGAFQGVANIVRFNWPMFFVAAEVSLICLLAAALDMLPAPVRVAALLIGLGTIAQTGASLLASHWVYDRSDLYDLTWLPNVMIETPRNIVNIHAGFDESSGALSKIYPSAELRTLDFYDPERTTERSIARARAAFPPTRSAESVSVDSLPLSDFSQDLVLLFLAAHEIRRDDEQEKFFQEIRRSLRANGRVILVEHLRDAANAIAYGPGCLHFHSRATWLRAIHRAGLTPVAESKITPLVRVFVCSPSS
jgi:SAM-dependent methyltransferase